MGLFLEGFLWGKFLFYSFCNFCFKWVPKPKKSWPPLNFDMAQKSLGGKTPFILLDPTGKFLPFVKK